MEKMTSEISDCPLLVLVQQRFRAESQQTCIIIGDINIGDQTFTGTGNNSLLEFPDEVLVFGFDS